jgi:hypothetical protein
MPILHLGQLQLEVRRRPLGGMMIPPIDEQDTADIQKNAGHCRRFCIVFSFVDRIIAAKGQAASSSGNPFIVFGITTKIRILSVSAHKPGSRRLRS